MEGDRPRWEAGTGRFRFRFQGVFSLTWESQVDGEGLLVEKTRQDIGIVVAQNLSADVLVIPGLGLGFACGCEYVYQAYDVARTPESIISPDFDGDGVLPTCSPSHLEQFACDFPKWVFVLVG